MIAVTVEEVLADAEKLSSTHSFRTDMKANIIFSYRRLTGASLEEALKWFDTVK